MKMKMNIAKRVRVQRYLRRCEHANISAEQIDRQTGDGPDATSERVLSALLIALTTTPHTYECSTATDAS